jgi:hypothetical protein
MRNKHYKAYSFRLDEPTIAILRELKDDTGKSYNLLFLAMIKKFNRKKYDSAPIN